MSFLTLLVWQPNETNLKVTNDIGGTGKDQMMLFITKMLAQTPIVLDILPSIPIACEGQNLSTHLSEVIIFLLICSGDIKFKHISADCFPQTRISITEALNGFVQTTQ